MGSSALESTRFTAAQLAAIRAEYAPGATDTQFANFIRECESRNLEPGRHVYFQLRATSVLDPDTATWTKVKRPIHLTSIDAFRLIAQRTQEYRGQSPPVYIYLDDTDQPRLRSDVPLCANREKLAPLMPWAVEVSVYRKNFEFAISTIARFEAYAVRKRDGHLNDMWEHRGPEQLAKCAEALALRKAFPEELGSIYIEEELPEEQGPAPYQATDADIPASIGQTVTSSGEQPVQQKLTVQEVADKLGAKIVSTKPSTKDRTEFVKRAREYGQKVLPSAGVADAEKTLKGYVLKKAGVGDAAEISKESWESILSHLDALLVSGGASAVATEVRSAT